MHLTVVDIAAYNMTRSVGQAFVRYDMSGLAVCNNLQIEPQLQAIPIPQIPFNISPVLAVPTVPQQNRQNIAAPFQQLSDIVFEKISPISEAV